MNEENSFLFRLDSSESDKKIESILEYFHQKPYYFIDTNGRVQYNLSKLNNLPRLITKMNNPNRMQSELIKLILFNYEFIYARSLLGDFEFLSHIASILDLNKENVLNVDVVMAYVFYDMNKNQLIASSHSILEQMRVALFDTSFNRALFDQHFFGKYSDENLSVLAFAHGKKFCLEKRSALVPFNTSWYFICVILFILTQLNYSDSFVFEA